MLAAVLQEESASQFEGSRSYIYNISGELARDSVPMRLFKKKKKKKSRCMQHTHSPDRTLL